LEEHHLHILEDVSLETGQKRSGHWLEATLGLRMQLATGRVIGGTAWAGHPQLKTGSNSTAQPQSGTGESDPSHPAESGPSSLGLVVNDPAQW